MVAKTGSTVNSFVYTNHQVYQKSYPEQYLDHLPLHSVVCPDDPDLVVMMRLVQVLQFSKPVL